MAYMWSKELETGNATIDSQHKELLQAVNGLLEACGSGKGRAEVQKTLAFLQDYTKKHFADEERLQQQYKYPGYIEHKKLHEQFKQVVANIAAKAQDGGGLALVGTVNCEVGDWLLKHIKREDVKVAAHVRTAQGK